MMLQALVKYYENLSKIKSVVQPGYSNADISFAININKEGEVIDLLPMRVEAQRGKKVVDIPQKIVVPEQPKRAAAILPYFLADTATYLLGLPKASKEKNEEDREVEQAKFNKKALAYFEASKALHLKNLETTHSDAAIALKNYFNRWQPELVFDHPIIKRFIKELATANLVFKIEGENFAQDDPAIQAYWKEKIHKGSNQPEMQCLITGEKAPIATLHPVIKGIMGGQSMGNTLVSFNARAFESYGRDKEQGLNAPISEYAAFAYTTALKELLSSVKNYIRIGDTTIVYWAETAEPVYCDFFSECINIPEDAGEKLESILKKIKTGEPIDVEGIDMDVPFYILGLAPNAARLSVRFFVKNQFSTIIENLMAHYQRLEIKKPVYDQNKYLSPWWMLNATVNQNNRDKKPVPQMAGATMQAILMNTKYPMALYYGILMRIKAEQGEKKISWERAATIKAILLKNSQNKLIKECLTVSLNEETNNKAYILGRLFSVLESIQEKANPGIKATIRDRYFNSACATPAMVFPTLIKLTSNHLKKIGGQEKGIEIYYQKQLGSLMGKIDYAENTAYPRHLSLEEQGVFQLGYYHQKQKRYEKQTKEEN